MKEKLFNKPPTGTVVVHDIDGNAQEVPIKKLKLRVSVYGVLKSENSILLQWNPLINRYCIPGGGIELGEKIEDALVREYREETDLTIRSKTLLTVKEDFFILGKEYAHSVLIFYEVEKVEGELSTQKVTGDSTGATFIRFADIDLESFAPPFKEILLSLF